MAGTVTATRDPRSAPRGKHIDKVNVAWTSDASGNATLSIENLYGFLLKMVTVPSGSAAPTDNYDITLVDENSIDALAGAGADRDTANTEQVYPTPSGSSIPAFLCGTHTFTVANAGNAKSGTAILYIVESL
jgi:hypothetical protein